MRNSIVLITPPSPFLLDERVFMHIGILKVASSLEAKGFNVEFLDLSGIENYLDALEDFLKTTKSKNFGITASTPQVPFSVKIAKIIRKNIKDAKLILGGPHVTLMNSASKREYKNNLEKSDRATRDIKKLRDIFDVIVCGDGEISIFSALEIETGVVDADDRKSPFFLSDQSFSDLPMPARHLVDVDSYHYEIEGIRSTSIIAQLGCPFRCTFCSGRNSPFLRKIRTRSIDSIVEEMRYLYKTYGFKGFMFYDDELNVNKEMVPLMNKISNLQKSLGVDFRLRGFVKAELFTDEQAAAMHRAGFRWLLTGFESGDPRILKNIKKNATVEDNSRCVEIAKRNNLKVKALMSIGHAGESHQSVENTKEWLLRVKPDDFDCTIITSYPGSPYFDDAFKDGQKYTYVSDVSGDKLYQSQIDYLTDLDYYKGDPDGGYTSYVWTDHMSPEDLVVARDSLESYVRDKLDIKFNPSRPGIKYEHSMGMGNADLPKFILKSSQ